MKQEQKHTPGPWIVKLDKEGCPFIGVASDPYDYPGTVAVVDGGYPEADARLIAAAPELLDIVQRVIRDLNGDNATMRATDAKFAASPMCARIGALVRDAVDAYQAATKA